ncbi:MAG: UDP-N-acetylmuramoyl-L-alanyl-D-glutamate--2,6-diaminopimelate ligase [Sedimentisphaerales bacterium]|nr:UDP-N-acetylmuramoyl-L-alanyl-D-glutamate--2,6-diaminopimelate ligase [Sedimentisphaerales bacterium]
MDFKALIKLVNSENAPRVHIDSRNVGTGDIFVAISGTEQDGHDFVTQAFEKGASCVVVCKNTRYAIRDTQYKIVKVDDTAQAAAILAQMRNANPSKKLINLAVTGTNGKTTVAFLVRSIINFANQKCGMIGTVFYDTGRGITNAPLTTPDCITIAAAQKQMVDTGVQYMVIEASSHALSQNRLAEIDFTAAAFTNLTGDHLDYHKTEDAYLHAKAILFENLSADATTILNAASPQSKKIAKKTKAKILYYGIDTPADITAHIESTDIDGTSFTLSYNEYSEKVHTTMPGLHNVSNCLAAAGLCFSAGFDMDTIAKGISNLKSVPGRLERVSIPSDERRLSAEASAKAEATSDIFIDYAHTDDALKNVLSTLRPLCKGRLIVVFGCGGDRDKTKRPRMAAVAEQLADITIVTSDNPRTENPMAIISDIITGFKKQENLRGTRYAVRSTNIVEPDRAKAIELSVNLAQKDDIILIAGKGHENYQIIGKEKLPFSDKAAVENCLKALV